MSPIMSYIWEEPFYYQHVSFYGCINQRSARIFLFPNSIANYNQINLDPTLIKVSSTRYFSIFFLFETILLGWYFWTHFRIATWLLLSSCKKFVALETHRVHIHEIKNTMHDHYLFLFVLFLLPNMIEIEHLQAIGLSLGLQISYQSNFVFISK
jgi:hypothetical protein